jgi:hypothetical protein
MEAAQEDDEAMTLIDISAIVQLCDSCMTLFDMSKQ